MTANFTYARWQRDETRRGKAAPPLTEDHPSSIAICLLCPEVLGTSEPVQTLVIGPLTYNEWDDHLEGGWYSAPALIVHQRCLAGLADDQLEDRVAELAALVMSAP